MDDHLTRIFWGDSSLMNLAELLFRTIFMYIYTLFLVRIIGKRGLATLAPFEMAVIVVLGSVLADPMMDMKTPLIKGMVVMTAIVALQRLLVHLTENNLHIENLLESSPRLMVSDGIINLESLHKEGFSREDLFLNLREKGVEHLGEVKTAFLETSGRVSVWMKDKDDAVPGLSIFPDIGSNKQVQYQKDTYNKVEGHFSCLHCGKTIFVPTDELFNSCENCHSNIWVNSQVG